jgi:hypothetical protein
MAAHGVRARHKDYDRYSRKWKRVRDVVAGQDEIHEARAAYLPMLVDETEPEYLARIERTPFYNATWRTMASFVGMLFRKPPTLEVPKKLEPLLKDVTTTGVSFNNFAQDVALEDIEISRVGVLVDYPVVQPKADGSNYTLAEAEALGFRPSMVMYKAEGITNWEYGFINNRTVLTQVRLYEMAQEKVSEFQTEEYGVIRVLDLFNGEYRVRRFKEENEEQIGWDSFPLRNGQRLNHIPFYFIGPDGSDSKLTEPVLIDLVDLNIKHYQVSADYEHGCHMTGLPTPVVSGLQQQFHPVTGQPVDQKLYIGSTAAWLLPQGAEAKFLEFTGSGLQALEKNLDRKENQMAAIGARMLTPEKAGVEAADTLAMRNSGEHSILGAIAIAVSEGLLAALKDFALWAGLSEAEVEKLVFQINRNFMPYVISPQALTALLAAVQAGKLSHESFFDLMKRGDLVEADVTFAIEQARIDASPPMPEPVAAPPGSEDDEPPAKDDGA